MIYYIIYLYRSVSAATGKRPYSIIRSTFPGLGKYGGHWLGDNNADWYSLRYSIIGMLCLRVILCG